MLTLKWDNVKTLFFQNCKDRRLVVIKEKNAALMKENNPHVRSKLLRCGDVEQNPGPQASYVKYSELIYFGLKVVKLFYYVLTIDWAFFNGLSYHSWIVRHVDSN